MERRATIDPRQERAELTATTPRPWRVSLVLPAYNEAASIEQAVIEADDALAARAIEYEILVVDDGSTDETAETVVGLSVDRPHVRLLRHEENQGYGAALRTGFADAHYDLVAFTDADCQFHLDDLDRLLPLACQYPVVAGYREHRQEGTVRRLVSAGYNLLTRILLGTAIRDCDCALKVFRRDELARLLPESPGYLVNAEMLARARQLRLDVAEVGVRHRPRRAGASKISLRDVPQTASALVSFWWSRVLFPGPASQPSQADKSVPAGSWRATALSLGLLVVLACLLFGTRLRAPLLEPQEPRYAEIPRQMLAQGEWVTPLLHGEPYLDKPPLLYWLVMGSYQLFGASDWAARLVPAVVGVLTVLITFLWGRRMLGGRAGLCGALCLCLMAGFVYRMRMLGMDGLLCLWVTAGLAAGHAAITGGRLRWGWWLAAALTCSLGLLTKGPVALLLVAGPILVYSALEPRAARVRWWKWAVFGSVAVGLAAPWYVAVALRQPDYLASFFWTHHVERFVAPFDHSKPAWFYLPVVLVSLLPWSLLLPGFMRFLTRRPLRQAMRRPMALGFYLLAGLSCIAFFSLAGCKRPSYILPALPALALALGCYIDRWMPARLGWSGLWKLRCRAAYVPAISLLILALALVALASSRDLLRPGMAVVLGLVAGVGLLVLVLRHRVSWATLNATSFLVLFLAVLHLLPAYNRQFALRGLRNKPALAQMQGLPVVCYPQRWDSVSFYLPQAELRAFGRDQHASLIAELQSRPETLIVVHSGKATEELKRILPPSLELVIPARSGALATGWVRKRQEAPLGLFAQAVSGDSDGETD